jgi:hypothetical protein
MYMKKLFAISVAASLVAMASPALAQDVTGTVNITGTVAPKCLVVPGAATSFSQNVALGELAQADGTLATDLAARFLSAGGSGLEARVVCTTAAPTISVDATEIQSTAAAAPGYANRIDFTANVAVTTTNGTANFSNSSAGAALSAAPIGGRLANNGGNNIAITATGFATENATDLLVAASDYTGQIVVVIAPGA